AKLKMTKPRYQEIASGRIPEVEREDGTRIRIIAGMVDGVRGPVTGIAADPIYLDVAIPPNGSFRHPVSRGHSSFAYLYQGVGLFVTEDGKEKAAAHPRLAVFGDGDRVEVRATEQGARLLLVSGKPLGEPIARYGPFVMNTKEEIRQALIDLQNGTFVQPV
ncbi:MAG: pirin family protein, partial [Anaerolineae bacterium]